MGPWWDAAEAMLALMEGSEVMEPWTVKRFGEGGRWVRGLRSWAVTLQPCSGGVSLLDVCMWV